MVLTFPDPFPDFRCDRALPAVEADPTQMRQVIMNLVINASEAIGEKDGQIIIATGARECDEPYLRETWPNDPLPAGRYVFLEVADNGCGMDRDTLTRIFDPFFSTKFTGRGLGLAAVLGIVRGHKGGIKVYSEVSRGTTFKVLFPATPRQAVGPSPGEAASEWGGQGVVLVADDGEEIRQVARAMLEELGFTVLTAVDGKMALALFREAHPRPVLVLLDLTMPTMGGEETYRLLRQIDLTVPVVMMSRFNEQEVSQKFLGRGLAGFVQKPFDLAALRQAIRRALAEEAPRPPAER
ncbi:MAG: Chemotaxis protein methyltransferase CheR [Candidatus Ozemobacter sibiricus]|uniref:histidine kinase n=1 Tax=Candidatus Ozemobacter sibiricus TaxID=2268124 RepID=A0A367ZM79_9BACT|nr:MAG: Chemotaxis protein methyltransferase CheR [Candidatus Ozemobacter sibiricus]